MLEERLARSKGPRRAAPPPPAWPPCTPRCSRISGPGTGWSRARALFGGCHWIVSNLLPRFGIATEFVDGADLGQWRAALSRPAQLVLVETPSNPMLEIVDLREVAGLAHAAGAMLVVDNVFATPLLQQPLALGADVVVYSCTKHIDGQGRVMGGAVLGRKKWVEETLQPFHPQHRALAVAVQRLAAAQGTGDAGAAGRCRLPRPRGLPNILAGRPEVARGSGIRRAPIIRSTNWRARK